MDTNILGIDKYPHIFLNFKFEMLPGIYEKGQCPGDILPLFRPRTVKTKKRKKNRKFRNLAISKKLFFDKMSMKLSCSIRLIDSKLFSTGICSTVRFCGFNVSHCRVPMTFLKCKNLCWWRICHPLWGVENIYLAAFPARYFSMER